MVLDLKILLKQNADEIERLEKIKEDSDREAAAVFQQLKILSESRDSMQRELVELRDVRDAAREVAEAMEIPERDGDKPLLLAGRLRIVPEAFERFVSVPFWDFHGLGYFLGSILDLPQRDKFLLH